MIYGVFTDLSAAIKRDLQRYRRPWNRGQMKVFEATENVRGSKYGSIETGAFNIRNIQRLLG